MLFHSHAAYGRVPVAIIATIAGTSTVVLAQSDPSVFDTVINIPDDVQSYTGYFGSDTQVNLSDGGEIGANSALYDEGGETVNVELNIYGGYIWDGFSAGTGGTINMLGGETYGFFILGKGGVLNLSGGHMGLRFQTRNGSSTTLAGGTIGRFFESEGALEIVGNDFSLNGIPNPDQATIDQVYYENPSCQLAGTLSDGSVFVIAREAGEIIDSDELTLTTMSLPPADLVPQVLSTGTADRRGLRPGQQLTITGDAELPSDYTILGATLNIESGYVHQNFEAVQSTVNLVGGDIGADARVYNGTSLHLSGGSVGYQFRAHPGSTVLVDGGSIGVNAWFDSAEVQVLGGSVGEDLRMTGSLVRVAGGSIGYDSWVGPGAELVIDSGIVDSFLDVSHGGIVRVQGGELGSNSAAKDDGILNVTGGNLRGFSAELGGHIELRGGSRSSYLHVENGGTLDVYGGEFMLNEKPATHLDDGFGGSSPNSGVLTGTYENGDVFIFSTIAKGDWIRSNTTTLHAVAIPPIDLTPILVTDSDNSARCLRAGQSMIVSGDGHVPDHPRLVDSKLVVHGGEIGYGLQAVRTRIEVNGGSFGEDMRLYPGCELLMTSGSISNDLRGWSSSVEVHGGTIGNDFSISGYKTQALIAGGNVGDSAKFGTYLQTEFSGGVIGHGGLTGRYSRFSMSGGELGERFVVNRYGRMLISGGSVATGLTFNPDSEAVFSGGQIATGIKAHPNSKLRVEGTSFMLGGVPVFLKMGESMTVQDRDFVLSGVLADGGEFSISLNAQDVEGLDYIDSACVLEIAIVPAASCLPDMNLDSVLDIADLVGFVALFLEGNQVCDFNEDEILDLGDITSFVEAFLAGC